MDYDTSLANSSCSIYTKAFGIVKGKHLSLEWKKNPRFRLRKQTYLKCKTISPNKFIEPPDYTEE